LHDARCPHGFAATFEGEFSEVTRSCAGKGVVRYTWVRMHENARRLERSKPPGEINSGQ
jgi:hypothetical protein